MKSKGETSNNILGEDIVINKMDQPNDSPIGQALVTYINMLFLEY